MYFQAALEAVKQKFGREIHVFETSTTSQTPDGASNNGMKDLGCLGGPF